MRLIRTNIYNMKDTIDILYKNYLLNTNIKELCPKQFNQLAFFEAEDYLVEYDNNLKDIEHDFKNRRNIKCVQLDIAFTFEMSNKRMKKVTKKVVDYLTSKSYVLPYISFHDKSKKRLIILFFDRYYYPEGKEVTVIAKSDYKNGKYKQGEVIKVDTIYMSHKLRIFNFSSKGQLSIYFDILRKYIESIFTNLNTESGTITDKKHVFDGKRHFKVVRKELKYEKLNEYRMRKIRAINMLARAICLNFCKVSAEVLNALKKRIYTAESVYEFEQQVLRLIHDV